MRWLWLLGVILLPHAVVSAGESTHRLHDGLTAHVVNPTGKSFTATVTVRDINIYETGPREVLCKVYDPEGKAVVREVIPDDGVVSQAFLPPMGAWDHEAWYYAYLYMKGTQPMLRWSAFSAPDRLKSVASRTFKYQIPAGKPGIYRLMLVGSIDHYVTLNIDSDLQYGVAGHPDWIHGHGSQWKKSFVYVPKGCTGLHVMLAEYDMPRSRTMTVKAPDGTVLFEGTATGAYTYQPVLFETPRDEQILTVEVSDGPGDYLLGLKLRFGKDPEVTQRGERAVTAVLAPDGASAKAIRNGALYHDDRLFWHPVQIRLYDWLKKIPADAYEVKDADGNVVEPAPPLTVVRGKPNAAALATRPGYVVLNGPHWRPTLCDRILHHYPAHKNKGALNLAIKDLIAGLRSVGPNDHVAVAVGGPFANMAYEYSNYAWHYWRAAWRLLKETDAPDELKALVRESFLIAGDRLAFCRTWERVNGNSYSLVLTALRYCHEATGDPLQKQLFDTYWERFTTGGWGDRTGATRSGPVQEGFAYDHHYGSYILTSWQSILGDLPDERFQKVYDRMRNLYSYTLADERLPTGVWSARTAYYPQWNIEKEGPFAWKGLPGPDFTESVNGGNEWFAARRAGYYVLTYHGRLSPKWESNAHSGQSGYGGGAISQLHIPEKGPVLASTLNGSYGEKMDISLWRTFRIHTVAGTTTDGLPFIGGDAEHFDAKLTGNKLTSSGDIRHSPIAVSRSYTFDADAISCTVSLKDSGYGPLLNLWVKNAERGKVAEGYEILPFVARSKTPPKPKEPPLPTKVLVMDGDKEVGPVTKDEVRAQTVLIDRGGFGIRVEFAEPRSVKLGDSSDTLMIRLVDKPTPASDISLTYRLVPWR